MNAAEKARIAREEAEKEKKELKERAEKAEARNRALEAEEKEDEKVREQIRKIALNKKWSTVTFGKYYYNTSKEPVEWLVLENFGNEITLVSKNIIDCHDLYGSYRINSKSKWSDSEMRDWLNDEFLDKAFTKNEQKFITTTEIDSRYGEDGTEISSSRDKVYLLSQNDIRKGKTLFGNKLLKCKPTKYAKSKSIISSKNKALWWLRDMSFDYYYSDIMIYAHCCCKFPTRVCFNKELDDEYISNSERKRVGVRPVITLKLDD